MSILSGLYSTLLVALMLSGIDKLLRPTGAAAAMITARMVPGSARARQRSSVMMARLLGGGEVLLGIAAGALFLRSDDARGALAPCLVALVYLGFAWFIRRVDAVSPGGSCGCFGSGSVSGPFHLATNVGATLVSGATALAIALGAGDTALAEVFAGPATAVPFVVAVTTGALMFLLTPSLVTELGRTQHGTSQTVATFSITEPIHR